MNTHMNALKWTNSEDVMMRDMLASGSTFLDVSDVLGKSRSAVAGRASRMGVKSMNNCGPVEKVAAQPLKVMKKPVARAPALPRVFLTRPIKPNVPRVRAPSNAVDKVTEKLVANSIGITFVDLDRDQCRFAIDESTGMHMMCCGAPVVDRLAPEGKGKASYCVANLQQSTRLRPNRSGY